MTTQSPDSVDVYSIIRSMWFNAHQKEKPQREEWAKLDGWLFTSEVLPPLDERVLIREDPGHLPCIGWCEELQGRVIWCALCDGDLWPMKQPSRHWRPIPSTQVTTTVP